MFSRQNREASNAGARTWFGVGAAWAMLLAGTGIAMAAGAKDTTPPAAVTDLAVVAVASDRITLSWTATGDDGMTGQATKYDVGYSYAPITEANWSSAFKVSLGCVLALQPPGSLESYTLKGLISQTTYYIRLKVADEVPNWSTLSNEVSGTTLPAETWSLETVEGETGIETGQLRSDLEFNPLDNNPWIAYRTFVSYTTGLLKLAHWNGSQWSTEVIDSMGITNEGIDLVFEPATGFPTISYLASREVLKFARWSGSSWVIETVDSGKYIYSATNSLAYKDGKPSIAYWKEGKAGRRKVMFASQGVSSWNLEVIEETTGGRLEAALEYDSDGNPTIAYQSDLALKFARKRDGVWIVEVVPTPSTSVYGVDMKYDNDPQTGFRRFPTISYIAGPGLSDRAVFLARWDGSQWNTDVIAEASGEYMDSGTSLAFDLSGFPIVAFARGCPYVIHLAQWNGSTWHIEEVTVGNTNGWSLAIEPFGARRPALSSLRYALPGQLTRDLQYSLRISP